MEQKDSSEALKDKEDQEQQKGEKEKHSKTAEPGQDVIFKSPKARSEIQKIIAKAVNKSKAKMSSNFAINTKIQHFKIVTESSQVKKITDIDDNAPMIELTIPEFIWPSQEKTMANLVNVKSRGVIQFIVLARSAHTNNNVWDAPDINNIRHFASYLICTISELKLDFGTVLRWTNPWGNAVVMGLDSSDLDMLQKFRTFVSTLRFVHQFFNTFPKDAMTSNFGLSVILKGDLTEFKEQVLAEALFARNKLYGTLETLQSETFTAADTTRSGVSKSGWRNVTLEGDDVFLESLNNFTATHWFNIGPGTVQIHGGDRRAETPEEIEARNRRKRFNMPIGQRLTTAAQESINKSYREEQKNIPRNLIAPPAHSYAAASRAQPPKKRK